MTDRILAYLEGRPIKVGDVLYDVSGATFTATPSSDLNYQLRMRLGDGTHWRTNTHFLGKQVLFWTPLPDDHPEVVAWKLRALRARLARIEASIEASLDSLTQELTVYRTSEPPQVAIVDESLAACARFKACITEGLSQLKQRIGGTAKL